MKWLTTLISDIYKSFTNEPGGFSARKLTAFASVVVAAYETYHHTDISNITTVIIIWLSIALLCLGIITAQQIIDFRNKQKD